MKDDDLPIEILHVICVIYEFYNGMDLLLLFALIHFII